MYTNEFKKKVISDVNLVKFIEDTTGTKLRKVGENIWQGHCPHPDHEDSTASFSVVYKPSKKDWTWYCYGCHNGNLKDGVGSGKRYWGSDIFSLVRWLSDYQGSKHVKDFSEAVREVCEYAGIPLEQDKYARTYAALRKKAVINHFQLSNKTIEYLVSRGLSHEDIESWGIGEGEFIERHGNERYKVRRITFPLLQGFKRIVGFSSRKMPEDRREFVSKYINSSSSDWFSKSSYLYGAHKLDDTCEEIRITEGVMDVILGDKYGANFVAPLGTAFTDEHAEMIKKTGKVPVFCQDGDEAGRRALTKVMSKMAKLGIYGKVLILPPGMDMADLANREKENLEKYIREHTLLYSQYCMKDIIAECDSRIQEVLFEMLPRLREAAASIQSEDERMVINGFVKERFGIDIGVA